jgi:preprotein translocase subunit SecG
MTLSIIERKYRTMILEYVLLAVLILSAVFIIVAVVFQRSADEGLSGTIAGGAETFFGKTKGKNTDKIFSRVTTVLSFIFVAVMVVMYILVAKAY